MKLKGVCKFQIPRSNAVTITKTKRYRSTHFKNLNGPNYNHYIAIFNLDSLSI